MTPASTQAKSSSPAKISFQQIAELAKTQGYLTYQQADSYLPDECGDSHSVDRLLDLADALRIDFIEGESATSRRTEEVALGDRDEQLLPEDLPKLTDDPIRMYLSQMCRIPLLNREEEIIMAKKIELTRKRFRRNLLRSFCALANTVDVLKKFTPENCRLIARSRCRSPSV